MELLLKRKWFTDKSTIGELSVNGAFECYTLEDKVRTVKIAGRTAIPAGRYEVAVNFSNRFQKLMPLLLNVPNFEGIRIHSGNTQDDTDGCILVGKTRDTDFVGNSRSTFAALFAKIRAAVTSEKVFIRIDGTTK